MTSSSSQMETAQLSKASSSDSQQDRHPEKRMKAAFRKFEEERMPELKQEWPTLKHS